jgi:hypothetical protein
VSHPTRRSLRLGSGAGYSGDRIEPALELAELGDIDYLIFECLAERTIALAQQAKANDPAAGFDPLLETRMRAVLPTCIEKGIRIVTNMGAANPVAAARATAAIAAVMGLQLKVAAVVGDDVVDIIRSGSYVFEESGSPVASVGDAIISANAYLGVAPICDALATGAQVVITGRAGDPALFMAPLVHEFGWSMDDWTRLGQGVVVGHLLECAGQITGGYFADPGHKDVPDLARLGFPIGEVTSDGEVVITKVSSAGGCVTEQTCKEQLLYEIHDPRQYFQPDVIADFSEVRIKEIGPDRVLVTGGSGAPAPGSLKVSVGYVDGFLGEGQISYAGGGAAERARLAIEIVRERLRLTGVQTSELRFDMIGIDSLHGPNLSASHGEPYEVRIRVAGRADSLAEAIRIGNEVETLYTNGPAGGGGATKAAREIVAVQSVLLPRELITPAIVVIESQP